MATPWDAVFKEIFTQWLEQQGAKVQTQVEVSRLPRTVDAVTTTDELVRAKLAQVSPFAYFGQHNLLEFKSPRDPLTPAEYKLILARAYLFLEQVGEDDLRQATVTVISATKPRRVLNAVPHLVKFQKEAAGLYRSDDKLPLYVLVVSELSVEKQNHPLLLFTSGHKRQVVLQELAKRREHELLLLAYKLYPKDVEEVFPVSKEFPTLEENIRFFIQDFGAKRILQEMANMSKELPTLEEDIRFFIRDFGEKRVMQELVDLIGLERAEAWLREVAEAQPKKRTRRSRQTKNGNSRRR